jgi:hypothetical protein
MTADAVETCCSPELADTALWATDMVVLGASSVPCSRHAHLKGRLTASAAAVPFSAAQ